MADNRTAIKQQILSAPDEVFSAVAEAVDERRGQGSRSLGSKALAVIEGLSVEDLAEWVNLARRKGDATMLQKLMDMAEQAEAKQDIGDLTVNLVPFTIPDKSLPQVVEKCDKETFRTIRKAVSARVAKEKAATERNRWDVLNAEMAARREESINAEVGPAARPVMVNAGDIIDEDS